VGTSLNAMKIQNGAALIAVLLIPDLRQKAILVGFLSKLAAWVRQQLFVSRDVGL
jgi:hypothetical protein